MAFIFFTPFFIAVYIVEWLITDNLVLNKEILQLFGLKTMVYISEAVSNQERVLMYLTDFVCLEITHHPMLGQNSKLNSSTTKEISCPWLRQFFRSVEKFTANLCIV